MEETVTQYRRLEEICNNEDDQINFLAIYETLAEALHINPDVCINWREQFDTVLEEMFSEARIEPICWSAVRACIDERFAMILTELKFHKIKPFQRLKESFDKVDDQTLVESLQKCYNEEAVLLKKLNKTPLEHLQMQCDKTIPLIDQKLTEIGNAEIVAQVAINSVCNIQETHILIDLEEVLAVLREIYQELKVLTEKLHTEINVYHDIVYQAILETVPLDEQLLPTLANLCKRLNSSLSAFILIVCHLCTIKDIFQFIRELADQSYQLLLEQIKNCFVIESNCATLKSQMLKLTNNRSKDLDVDLRGLGMASLLECGIISFPQQVTINFYSEEDIGTKAKPVFPQMKDTAPLLKSVNDDLRSEFKEVHLGVPKKTTPPTKQHLVTDFMYYLTFTVKIKTCFNDFPDVDIDVHYKPVVIISQTSQSNAAMGTLKWNCLARNKDLIGEREHITWDELEKYLREWWFKETTAQLTQEHLLYLRQRLPLDTDLNVITKSIIMKELINNDLTFWKWFSSCVNLVTHENVDQEYKQGHIVGFISRDAAIRTLVNEKPFTFLVRFSENECQASQKEKPMAVLVVSIVYFHQATPVVEHVKKMFNGKNTYLHEGQLRFNLISMEFDQNGRHRLLQHISKRDSEVEPYKEKYDKGFNNSEYTPALYQTLVPLKHSCDEVPAPEKEELDATRGDNQHMEGPLPPGYLDQEPALSPEDFPDLFTEGGQPVQLFPDSTMTEADSVFLTPPYQENSPLMPQVSPNDVSDDLSNNMNSAEQWLIENMEDLSGNCEMQTA